MPVRVYELSHEFDLPTKDVVEACRKAGLDVKSHSSTIEEYEANMVRRILSGLSGDEDAEDESASAPAAAEPPPPAPAPPPKPVVPEFSPEEQLARARSMHIALPTRGAGKPTAEGAKLVRRPPPSRPGAPVAPGAAPAETAAPAAAEAPPAPAEAAPPAPPAPVAPVAEAPAAVSPEALAVPPVAAPAAPVAAAPAAPPPAAPQAEAPPVASAPGAPPPASPAAPETPVASAPAATPEVAAEAASREARERSRAARRPPRIGLAPKPKTGGSRLAQRPKPHPQAVKEPEAPPPHPQAAGIGVPKKKESPARPGRPKPKGPAVPAPAPAVPPAPPTEAEAAEAEKRNKRRGVKKPGEEEAEEGKKRAHAFRRRERKRSRDDGDDGALTGEDGGSSIISERVRISRTGRTISSRPSRPSPMPAPAGGPRKTIVDMPITVKSLSAVLGVKASDIITYLMPQGIMASLNDSLSEEQAMDIALHRDIEIEVRRERQPSDILKELETRMADSESLVPRPPVVVFMGHVDHGKTSLMDFIRKTRVAEGEAGGITQHIGAYRVHVGDRWITFLDTPGHEAFTAMRSRGARVTDVAVLVVAGDDGVMPQTEEAINHAKAAGVPIVVAINKCDLPQANPQRVKQQLTQYGLITEEWGGQTICIECSAVTGANVDKLLESLLLEAEMRELKAAPDRPALGTVIEAQLTEGMGPVATLLVQNGTLRAGDVVLVGTAYGKVRALNDENGRRMKEAGPTVPVRVSGLSEVPTAGDRFYVLEDITVAKQLAGERSQQMRQTELVEARKPRTLEAVFEQMAGQAVKELAIIIKADVQGSVEALRENLEKIKHPEVLVRVIHAGVGGVNESDVLLADASNAVIIGFNAVPDIVSRRLAEARGVDIRQYRIIYNVTDDIRKALEGLLAPQQQEHRLGECNVAQTFKISHIGTVAGCMVTDGVINRNARVRLIRDGVVVHTGGLQSLKRVKDDVREVRAGQDCGLHLAGYDDIKVGDRIEAFETVSVARTL